MAAARRCADRATKVGQRGRTISENDFDQLTVDLGLPLPVWMRELLTSVPLCGLDLGWQEYPPTDQRDGMGAVRWSDAEAIRSESVDVYPGLAIRAAGFVNVGLCPFGSGDPFFVDVRDGDDPPLYRVYHDVSDQPEVIISKARRQVAANLSTFFATAAVRR